MLSHNIYNIILSEKNLLIAILTKNVNFDQLATPCSLRWDESTAFHANRQHHAARGESCVSNQLLPIGNTMQYAWNGYTPVATSW